jgi:2-methylcitrate dehydratase PrpD
MPFGAAVALTYGRASLAEYAPGMPDRPEVRRIMPLVTSVIDPELEAHFPKEFRAWAEVSTSDGRRLRSDIRYPKGDPENALSWEEMKDKFRVLSTPVVGPERQQQIIDAVEDLEHIDDVRQLAALLSTEQL